MLSLQQRKFSLFYNLLVVINEVIFRSVEANVYLSTVGMIKAIVAFLSEDFVRKCARKKVIVLLLVKNLSLLSRWTEDARTHEWQELCLVDVFLNTTRIVEETSLGDEEKAVKEIVLNAYYAIGNVADDRQIEALSKRPVVIETLLQELVLVEQAFAKDKLIEKVRMPFLNEDKSVGFLRACYLNRITTPNLIGLARFAVKFVFLKIQLI